MKTCFVSGLAAWRLRLFAVSLLSAIVVIIQTQTAIGQQRTQQQLLPLAWKFSTGDQTQFSEPGFDDASWPLLQSGKSWEKQGYPGYNGVAWYRLQVRIDASLRDEKDPSQCIVLALGKIDDADDVFVNGRHVGATGGHEEDREYVIPYAIIKWDQPNTIAIRVKDTGGDGGLYSGSPYLSRPDKFSLFLAPLPASVLPVPSQAGTNVHSSFRVRKKYPGGTGLSCQAEIVVRDDELGEIIHRETRQVSFKGSDTVSVPVSYRAKHVGRYTLEYKLHHPRYRDTIAGRQLLAYAPGNRTQEKFVAPLVNTTITGNIQSPSYESVKLSGYLQERVQANTIQRLLQVDETGILECYYNRPGKQTWVGEYTGKYLHAASRAWRYSHNPALKAQMDRIVDILLSCQLEDGYLGTYLPKDYWTAWDVWAHKYNMLGLISYYEATGYKPALEACKKMAGLLIRTFGTGPGQLNIVESGGHVGMASTSVLEPMVMLYQHTANPAYLDFCKYIIAAYDGPKGSKIVTTLNTIGKVDKTANAKAYEMLSNLTGIVRLFQVTNDSALLKACMRAWKDITDYKLYITGTSSDHEHFQDDYVLPAGDATSMGEGCVTTTWLQFNDVLFRLTADPRYVDEIEKTVYNHLFAAENPNTGCVSYYTALQGIKPYRCTINAHCCLASVPRGIVEVPALAFCSGKGMPVMINLYSGGRFTTKVEDLSGTARELIVDISTSLPQTSSAQIEVQSDVSKPFAIALRVPSWTKRYSASVGTEKFQGIPGEYLVINRTWRKGDRIQVDFDMTVRYLDGGLSYPGYVAVKRGAQVLAFDQQLNPGITSPDSLFITPADIRSASTSALPAGWFGREVYVTKGIYRGSPVDIVLTPYAEAGQTGGLVQVWLRSLPGASAFRPLQGPARERTPELEAWEKLKFGALITFGPNTYNGGKDLDDGKLPAAAFNPDKLDVEQWVSTAKAAGMKYAVLVTKHSSGFCLWDSRDYAYDVGSAGNKTDIVDAFVRACEKMGLRYGFYYCILDSRNAPDMKVSDTYQALILRQLTELHSRYPNAVEQWIDIPQLASDKQRWEMYQVVKSLNDKCLVLSNQTLAVSGKNRGQVLDPGSWPTDLMNGEMYLPPASGHSPAMTYGGAQYYIPFELCDNASDNGGPNGGADKDSSADNWFDSPKFKMRSATDLFWLYKQCELRKCNLLLNLPPDKHGLITVEKVEALKALRKLIDQQ